MRKATPRKIIGHCHTMVYFKKLPDDTRGEAAGSTECKGLTQGTMTVIHVAQLRGAICGGLLSSAGCVVEVLSRVAKPSMIRQPPEPQSRCRRARSGRLAGLRSGPA